MASRFKRFHTTYTADVGARGPGSSGFSESVDSGIWSSTRGFDEFFGYEAFESYEGGLVRFFLGPELTRWNSETVLRADWPMYSERIRAFGADWLGRFFVLDLARSTQTREPLVGILEPGTGQLLETPYSFTEFVETGLVDDAEAALAISFFHQWRMSEASALLPSQCAGYKIPLFLGGVDELPNIEICDLEVYASLLGQTYQAVLRGERNLPIHGFNID